MNIGVLVGCLANTIGEESQRVARPLNNIIFEDARNMLTKYQAFKEWMILLLTKSLYSFKKHKTTTTSKTAFLYH